MFYMSAFHTLFILGYLYLTGVIRLLSCFVCVHDNRWDKIGVEKMMREDEFSVVIPDMDRFGVFYEGNIIFNL